MVPYARASVEMVLRGASGQLTPDGMYSFARDLLIDDDTADKLASQVLAEQIRQKTTGATL